jgi:hypothetical protein
MLNLSSRERLARKVIAHTVMLSSLVTPLGSLLVVLLGGIEFLFRLLVCAAGTALALALAVSRGIKNRRHAILSSCLVGVFDVMMMALLLPTFNEMPNWSSEASLVVLAGGAFAGAALGTKLALDRGDFARKNGPADV